MSNNWCQTCGRPANGIICKYCMVTGGPYAQSPGVIDPYSTFVFANPNWPTPGKKKDVPIEQSTEPIVGYRVWKLNKNTCALGSCIKKYDWPFRVKMSRDDFNDAGIHAVNDIKRLYSGKWMNYPHGEPFNNGLWAEYEADVAGQVYLWGEVKEHSLGYTAQYAYPKKLYMPEDSDPITVLQLEENYGVPVELRSEFRKEILEELHRWYPGAFIPMSYKFKYTSLPSTYPAFVQKLTAIDNDRIDMLLFGTGVIKPPKPADPDDSHLLNPADTGDNDDGV